MEIPAIIKILLVFTAVLAITRLRVPLGAALVLGGVGLDAWAGHGPGTLLGHFITALLEPDLWLLLLITVVIIELGRFIAAEHNANAIIAAARQWGGRHGRAISLIVTPAVIGMVPMPGGALFSAPFVEQIAREEHWAAEWKTVVNYWFRHIWEYWWPLYPVTILNLSIFQLETWQYMCAQLPMTVIAVAAGYFFLLHPHLAPLARKTPGQQVDSGRMALVGLALAVVVASALFLPTALSHAAPGLSGQACKLLSILVGLLLALAIIMIKEPRNKRHRLFDQLFTSKSMNILSSLAGVLIFKFMMEKSELLPQASTELLSSGIPVLLVIGLLPFIAGLVTGIAVGFAGTSFPLVAGFIATDSAQLPVLSTVVLAFACGYAGMMLSPVHLCFILTRDYFSASLTSTYRHLLPCVLTVLLGGIVLSMILRLL